MCFLRPSIRPVLHAALFVACLTTIGITAWSRWPEWQRYRVTLRLINEVVSEGHRLTASGEYPMVSLELDQRIWAVRGLHADGAATHRLIPLLSHEDKNVRRMAAHALGWMDANSDVAVDSLLVALRDSDDDLRFWAAVALGRMEAHARSAVPALLAAAQADRFECGQALEALGRIAPKSEAVQTRLIEMLDSSDRELRKTAAATLAHIGPAAKPAVPALVKTLSDRAVREEKGELFGHFYTSSVGEIFMYALQEIDPVSAEHFYSNYTFSPFERQPGIQR